MDGQLGNAGSFSRSATDMNTIPPELKIASDVQISHFLLPVGRFCLGATGGGVPLSGTVGTPPDERRDRKSAAGITVESKLVRGTGLEIRRPPWGCGPGTPGIGVLGPLVSLNLEALSADQSSGTPGLITHT